MSAPSYLVGLDLGQARDYSAWVVAERRPPLPEPTYDVGHIDRVRDARYPAVVAHTRALVEALRQPVGLDQEKRPVVPTVRLIVDYTGVGRPVADMLIDAKLGVPITLVTITGAEQTTRGETGEWRVPKRDLAGVVQVLLQSERLRIDEGLPLREVLTGELTNFRVKISLTGHDSYGAGADWREGNHDDLVLALALACWHGERFAPAPAVAAVGVTRRSTWNGGAFAAHDAWRNR